MAALAAVAAGYPATEIGTLCHSVLNFTRNQANAIHANGWENLADFEGYSTTDLTSWMTTSNRTPATRGGCIFPTVRSRRLCALNYWINRRLLRGIAPNPDDFDADALRTSLADYLVADTKREADDAVDKPEPFAYDKWVDWQDTVINFLRAKKNVSKNIPLYYIIRPNNPPAVMTETDEILWNAPLAGAAYDTDNTTVHQILTELTTGTDADQWIKEHRRTQNGRAAWQGLCAHYDGPAEGDKRVTVARHDIKLVHYRNESSFSFEKYSTRLKRSFFTLSQYEQPKSEREKVDILLSQINTNDQKLITAIGICRDAHSNTFEEACTYLSQQVAIIYPQHQPNAFGKKGKGGKRPNIRGINAVTMKNGKTMCNGVDLTDTTRFFTNKQFNKIGKEGRDYLNKCPKRKAFKDARRNSDHKRGKKNDDIDNRHVAAIINGVMQASRNETESVAASTLSGSRMPQHGPHARAAAATSTSTRSNRSNLRFDHTGNIIEEE